MPHKAILIASIMLPFCFCRMDPFVVGGNYSNIKMFPHSAFLRFSCVDESKTSNWICGSSIVNQAIVLTAAHCLYGCSKTTKIHIVVGNEHRTQGTTSSIESYVIHKEYSESPIKNDIALAKLKTPLRLNNKVKRVVLMKNPPSDRLAVVAGWGLINEGKKIGTNYLKYTTQKVWKRSSCLKVFNRLPEGCICAGVLSGPNYASSGDSGSALIIREYIQIGLVSYKNLSKSRSLVVYTDVSYFYNWIQVNSKRLYCGLKKIL